ncbi:MAG: AsmA family protein [Desulfovibrionaceae bacterium]
MSKAVKWILLLGGGLVVLLVAAMVLVAAFVDPNDYKDKIAQGVKDATGMELTIEGDLSLRFFPWIGVDTGAIRLGNPPGFGDEPFVSLNSASVSLRLLPLLSGTVKAGAIDVDGLALNLLRTKDGKANWEALGGSKEAKPEEPAKEGGKMDLSIGGLNVTNANIVFDDQQAGKRYALQGANISLGAVDPGEPFDVEVAFGLESKEPQVKADVRVKAVAALDLEAQVYELTRLEAEVAATGDALPGGKAEVNAAAKSILADMGKELATIDGLSVTAYGVTATAEMTASELKTGPKAKGQFKVQPFDAKKMLAAMGQTPPETTDPKAMTDISLGLEFDYGPQAASARNILLNLDGQEIRAEASMIGGAVPAYNVKVEAATLNLDPYRAPKAEGEPQAEAPKDEDAANKPILPESAMAQLRKLRLDAQLKVGQLKASPAELTNVLVLIKAKDGVVTVEPAAFTLYEGTLHSNMSMDVRGTTPAYGLDAKLNGLAVGPLLHALQGKESLSGRTNAETSMRLRGNSVNEFKRSLNGNLRFDMQDGVFPGVDFAGVMTSAYDKLQAAASGEVAQPKEAKTQFGLMQGSATFTNGLVHNPDFVLKSPLIQVDGEGDVNLPSSEVNYLVVGALLASLEGQGRTDKSEYVGVGIPIRVKGTFDNLSFWPDPVKWAEMIAGGALNIFEGGADSAAKAPGALLDAVTGGAKKPATEGAAPETGKDTGTSPVDKVGDKLKSIF